MKCLLYFYLVVLTVIEKFNREWRMTWIMDKKTDVSKTRSVKEQVFLYKHYIQLIFLNNKKNNYYMRSRNRLRKRSQKGFKLKMTRE